MGKVALITGANRGIGFEVCRQLCRNLDVSVVLTARSKEKGEASLKELRKEGLKAYFLQLDVTSSTSVDSAAAEFEKTFGHLDVLINNAGITPSLKQFKTGVQSHSKQVQETIKTNFFGTLEVCHAFYPYLNPHSRVVFISSMTGKMSILREDLQKMLCDPQLTERELVEIMKSYVSHVEKDDCEEYGWPSKPFEGWLSMAYAVSKIGVTTLAHIHGKKMMEDERKDILVNACCPGWIRTNMGGPTAPLSVEEGAAIPLYLAQLPPGGLNGVYYRENRVERFFTF